MRAGKCSTQDMVVSGGIRTMRALIAFVCILITLPAFAQVPGADWAGSDDVTFYLDFEDTTYALKAAGNPYQFGYNFELVDGGLRGTAWQATHRLGYIGFDGLDNVPLEAGTVSMYVKSGDANIFTDGEAHCFASLCRTTEGMLTDESLWPKQGLAMSLRKTEANTIDLIAHVGGDEWNWDAEDVVVASVDAAGLDPDGWHHLAFSWDFDSRGMWLVVDGEVAEGEIPETIERPHEYLAAIFGNTYHYRRENQQPLGGMMDEIAILSVPWPEAESVMAADAPLTAERPQDPTWTAEATLFPDDPDLARCEQVARQHLRMMLETQRHGGWCLSIKWPSMLQWTAKFRMPEPRNMIWLSKDSHTAFGAAEMLFAYEATGDERYLQAARATGDMYIETQNDEFGLWHHGYYYEDGRYIPDAGHHALIQDHCQTGPIFLLCYLHRVTGEQKYLDAAKKGADFLIIAQNANGSWPHHWLLKTETGVTARGIEGGGEVNDYGTSGPVQALLNMHEYTGDERYREAALRGADWLVEAFIDNGEIAGWAGQYDAENNPAPARHFEPPSVTQYGARWAASGLYAAYRETLDEKYLAPMARVIEWFNDNAIMFDGEEGWWWDYDAETGRPIKMYRNEVYFLDDPAQVEKLVEVTAADGPPRPADRVNVPGLRNQYEDVVAHPEGRVREQPTQEELAEYVERTAPYYVRAFIEGGSPPLNERVGLYTWEYQSGLGTNLVRHQVVRFCDLMMRARAARGDIPADNPLFRRIDAYVSWNKVLLDYGE
ncbi:MAG: hypothetical protein GF393_07290 [Armatimonadia bacterium]|nr:hypothetical protein [Armatimonadia bacterium]